MLTQITVYNLSVKIQTKDHQLRDTINRFIKSYYTVAGYSHNPNQAAQDTEFVSRIADGSILMHTNQFVHLLHHLKEIGMSLENVERIDERQYKVISTAYEMRSKWELRDYQQVIHDFIVDNPVRSKMVDLQTGKGKAQPLDAKIKTPHGWTVMGAVTVGDVITAPDGTYTSITEVHPQGLLPIYRVTFADGRTTECCDEHLWKVCESNSASRQYWKIIDTKEMRRLMAVPHSQVYIPLIESDKGVESPALFDPYTLGTLLARGEKNCNDLAVQIFKEASSSQRLAVVQGVLDTIETLSQNGAVTFDTANQPLAEFVQYLIRSLGGMALLRVHETASPAVCEVYIRVNHPRTLFRLQRKKDTISDDCSHFPELKLQVISIEPVGSKHAQCISVDHPEHLYVTDDFIVTHNTMIAMYALATIGKRISMSLPGYLDKWVGDIVKLHEAKTTDIMVITGSKSIRALAALARDNEITARYFIFSGTTILNFIKEYEDSPENCLLKYTLTPFELFPIIGTGSLLIDETHQKFHATFKILLYSNVVFQLGLSATLVSDDSVVSRMHKIVYTDKQTYKHEEIDKYIDVYSLAYYFPQGLLKQVKTTNFGSNSYSHTAFENSIMKNKPLLAFYMQLIVANFEAMFVDKHEAKDKCLIFVGTVKMATIVSDLLKKLFPQFKVRRYCEDDDEENLYESDVCVSTVISSGTAVDIEDLRVVLQTVNISSSPQNIQNLGRLRKLSNDRDVRFAYLFAENIKKQVMYHHKREELFAPRCASHRTYKAKTTPSVRIP